MREGYGYGNGNDKRTVLGGEEGGIYWFFVVEGWAVNRYRIVVFVLK